MCTRACNAVCVCLKKRKGSLVAVVILCLYASLKSLRKSLNQVNTELHSWFANTDISSEWSSHVGQLKLVQLILCTNSFTYYTWTSKTLNRKFSTSSLLCPHYNKFKAQLISIHRYSNIHIYIFTYIHIFL